MTDSLRFASALSRSTDPLEAANEIVRQLRPQLGDARPHLALAFFSGYSPNAASHLAEALTASIEAGISLGCNAESVIAREIEIENEPAVSVIAAILPDVELSAFAISANDWPEVMADPDAFKQRVAGGIDPALFIMLGDPYLSPTDDVLDLFNTAFEGIPVIGGMASLPLEASNAPEGESPASNLLFLHQQGKAVQTGAAVGVCIGGAVEVDVIVSQGCRPVGPLFTITEAQQNMLMSLEGQPPMQLLQQVFEELSDADRELIRNGVYLGRAIDPEQEELGRGDFLVRGVMGADPKHGYLAVGDFINNGERVQFHLRDADTATEDLEMMLLPQSLLDPPAGAFIFSCNGRGTRMYDHPNGDISVVQNILGNVPIAGFFCAGEIGPVGGKNFFHGQTASMVIFRQKA
jgi:small ligand-binding sensory domain FIST